MKIGFKNALKVFKYLSVAFSIVYWIYVIFDDYIFIEKYGLSFWAMYLGIWVAYFFFYFLVFAFWFWIISSVIIIVHLKFLQRKLNS